MNLTLHELMALEQGLEPNLGEIRTLAFCLGYLALNKAIH